MFRSIDTRSGSGRDPPCGFLQPSGRKEASNGSGVCTKLFQIDIFGTTDDGQNVEQAEEGQRKSEFS